MTQYTNPVYRVNASTPREEVGVSGWFSKVTDDGASLLNQRRGTAQLPLPAGALAADGDDGQIIMVDEETGEEWGASHFERDLDGSWTVWNAYSTTPHGARCRRAMPPSGPSSPAARASRI